MLGTRTKVVCYSQVRRGRVEDNQGTDSYNLRERLEVPRSLVRDRKIWKAGTKLAGSLEPLARSRSFIPSPSQLM